MSSSKPSSNIRSASHKETPQIVDMIRAGAEEGVFFPWHITVEEHRDLFRKNAFGNPQENYRVYVCQSDNEVVGYIDTTIRRGVGHVIGIYVLPNHRRKGIGQKLINHILKRFKERECHKAQVKVFEHNTGAIEFYVHTNFIHEAILRQDEGKMNMLIMSQFFN